MGATDGTIAIVKYAYIPKTYQPLQLYVDGQYKL
jgi:hypothetical protein